MNTLFNECFLIHVLLLMSIRERCWAAIDSLFCNRKAIISNVRVIIEQWCAVGMNKKQQKKKHSVSSGNKSRKKINGEGPKCIKTVSHIVPFLSDQSNEWNSA